MNIAHEARLMLRTHHYGALCTLSKKFDGHPFGSITPYCVDHDGSLLILISTLAEHTKNILHDRRVSLITHNQNDPHIQTQGRLTIVGEANLVTERDLTGKHYLRYFPEAQTYFQMHDFSLYRIAPIAIRYISGFGKIHWVNMDEYPPPQPVTFAQMEVKILDLLNNEQKNLIHTLLHRQHGVKITDGQVIGLDCDGLAIRSGDQLLRLDFADTIHDPAQTVQVLEQTLLLEQ